MTIDDGGPAFPSGPQIMGPDGCWSDPWIPGMTLRDYFAGQALAVSATSGWAWTAEKACAKWCYDMADAMLAARKEQP